MCWAEPAKREPTTTPKKLREHKTAPRAATTPSRPHPCLRVHPSLTSPPLHAASPFEPTDTNPGAGYRRRNLPVERLAGPANGHAPRRFILARSPPPGNASAAAEWENPPRAVHQERAPGANPSGAVVDARAGSKGRGSSSEKLPLPRHPTKSPSRLPLAKLRVQVGSGPVAVTLVLLPVNFHRL